MINRIIIFIFISFSVYSQIMADEEKPLDLDTIIQNMELAADPENNKINIKTLITVIDFSIPAQNLKMKITVTDKFPDKTKTVKEIPGVVSITRILNGDQAWETSNLTEVREIKGQELELLKYELYLKTPAVPIKKAFKEIKLDAPNVLVEDEMCYKLICKPAVNIEVPDIVMYVNKNNFLPVRIDLTAVTPQGPITFTTVMEEYKKINGRMIPVRTKILQSGMTMQKTLVSVKENIEIDDTEFENPTVEVIK